MSAVEEFYVGYLPTAPPGLARRTRRVALALGLLALLGGAALSAAHRPLATARFAFGERRTFEGTLVVDPVPLLLVERPGAPDASGAPSRWLVVGPGKLGAERWLEGFAGRAVALEGTLVHRDGRTMVELVPGTVRAQEGRAASGDRARASAAGGERVTLTGEIVDSKCFLGVMVPGERKPHRACAVRCISGGIPPILHARAPADEGGVQDVLLVGPEGESLGRAVLPFVAEPVRVTGRLEWLGDLPVLHASPSDIVRLP